MENVYFLCLWNFSDLLVSKEIQLERRGCKTWNIFVISHFFLHFCIP